MWRETGLKVDWDAAAEALGHLAHCRGAVPRKDVKVGLRASHEPDDGDNSALTMRSRVKNGLEMER